jgi:hypothetical protein
LQLPQSTQTAQQTTETHITNPHNTRSCTHAAPHPLQPQSRLNSPFTPQIPKSPILKPQSLPCRAFPRGSGACSSRRAPLTPSAAYPQQQTRSPGDPIQHRSA